jgi:hypothetical protein
MTTPGFDRPLYLLPFDHRGTFQTKMFGWSDTLSPEQTGGDRCRQAGDL